MHCTAYPPCPGLSILSQAVVVVPDNLSGPEKKAVEMLVDEVQKRTQIRWPVANAWPKTGPAVIAVGPGLVRLPRLAAGSPTP